MGDRNRKTTKPTVHTDKRNTGNMQARTKNYKQLLEDLKNAEDIRKKEAAIIGEKTQLQAKFGSASMG